MKVLALVLSTILAGCVAAKAGDISPMEKRKDTDILVGSGLICDTRQQAERFVNLMSDDVENTLLKVNDEAGQSDACVVATIGFFPGQKVAELAKNGTVVNIIEVLVMAVSTETGLKIVEPKMFYSVVETRDRIT